MLRVLVSAALLIALGACNTSYRSAIDLAPATIRPAASPIAEGLYCMALVSWRADGEPVAAMNGAKDTCVQYRWDAGRRLAQAEHLEREAGEGPQIEESAVIPLGDGIFLAQSGEASADENAPYTVTLALAEGGAIAAVSVLDRDAMRALAKRFPAVILGESEGDAPEIYIKSGDLTAIHAYLRDAARLGLALPDGDGNFTLQMMVRVDTPLQETVFSLLKRPDVAALKARVPAAARSAPPDIGRASQSSRPYPF